MTPEQIVASFLPPPPAAAGYQKPIFNPLMDMQWPALDDAVKLLPPEIAASVKSGMPTAASPASQERTTNTALLHPALPRDRPGLTQP